VIDKNNDNFVSLDEMKAAMPNAQAKMMVGMMFGRFDANGDKKISKAEWAAAPMPMFDRADTNKDNKVTQDEIKALRR
jgi:Ca2+-binding EF-hand superfamily protein